MKLLNTLFLFIFTTSFFSCNLFTPEEEQKPPHAPNDYEIFINGEEYRARGWGNGALGPNPLVSYTEFTDNLILVVENDDSGSFLSFVASKLEEQKSVTSFSADFHSDEQCIPHSQDSSYNNNITLTHLDKENEIIVFNFDLTLTGGCDNDTLHVTGWFDYNYLL